MISNKRSCRNVDSNCYTTKNAKSRIKGNISNKNNKGYCCSNNNHIRTTMIKNINDAINKGTARINDHINDHINTNTSIISDQITSAVSQAIPNTINDQITDAVTQVINSQMTGVTGTINPKIADAITQIINDQITDAVTQAVNNVVNTQITDIITQDIIVIINDHVACAAIKTICNHINNLIEKYNERNKRCRYKGNVKKIIKILQELVLYY